MLSKKEFDSLIKMVNKKTTVKSLLKLLEKEFIVTDPVSVPAPSIGDTSFVHKPRKSSEPEDATHERELKSGFKVATENRASKIDHIRGAPTVGP